MVRESQEGKLYCKCPLIWSKNLSVTRPPPKTDWLSQRIIEKQKPYIYCGRDCQLSPITLLLISLEVLETQILAGYVAS